MYCFTNGNDEGLHAPKGEADVNAEKGVER